MSGTVLANEYLDALPVHRVIDADGRLREVYVDWDPAGDRFIDAIGDVSTAALGERLEGEGIVLAGGARAEICLAIDDWAMDASERIGRGFTLVIDYGRAATELYSPSRTGGTLRAYTGHRAHADPFVAIGRQDLTAHVDFTAVERAAATSGWHSLGLTTQAEFLTGSGLADLLSERQADPALGAPEYLALRSSVMRLLDPAALGGFRVLALGRGAPADVHLSGLGYRLDRGAP